MRLATFRAGGRASYGAVTGQGVIDLGRRLGTKYPALIDLIRADALGEARAAMGGPPRAARETTRSRM